MSDKLEKSYKGRFPFRLATTSFIYPADWVTNVRRLGPYLDEIELLILEGRPDALPTPEEIATLAALGLELGLTYNIHLPYDLSPCDPDRKRRSRALDAIRRVIDLSAPLAPTTHTLHLPFDGNRPAEWQKRTDESITRLTAMGVDPASLTIETLDYPFDLVEDIVETHDLRVCIDVGHLIVHDMGLEAVMDRWLTRTAICHLHGAAATADHLPLDRMDPQTLRAILGRLRSFSGTVSLEVFRRDHLAASLRTLDTCWNEIDRNGSGDPIGDDQPDGLSRDPGGY
jgi:sugar phosphate isomerase/epimerase